MTNVRRTCVQLVGRAPLRGVVAAIAVAVASACLAVSPLFAQRGRTPDFAANVPYDGRYTFVRLKYDIPMGTSGFRRPDIKWSHDYPRGETHFTKIVGELSTARMRGNASNIIAIDDPELGKYPVSYMCEPGFWHPSDKEIVAFRKYLLKGGFVIFDDFAGEHWLNFESQMQKVFPTLRPVRLSLDHPIFDAFYRIKTLEYEHPYYRGMKSVFYGYFEDNDPKKRMLAIANYNNDISEYWEFSDTGMFPLAMSNEAYKLGVNYIIYALTR